MMMDTIIYHSGLKKLRSRQEDNGVKCFFSVAFAKDESILFNGHSVFENNAAGRNSCHIVIIHSLWS